ncbi:segregation and condensation protein B [Compostibacillus humi]|uniref:Segregation and condensation protein B n=1 Tax=Compostibacillus humi TaxID=1245525 RepID=A0A8J2ZQH1_9BACI|nr:SMC-Scp complex subunit ScpB [Compostibacillus humi]GGH69033.1 segregation and condensation protein B [Compostibacillus humi]
MDKREIKGIIEGLLFASGDEGITRKQIVKIVGISLDKTDEILEELKLEYDQIDRGIMIMEFQDVLHLTTKPMHSHFLKKLLEIPRSSRMSQAALETLAIIAYNQPITKTEIENIRGVSSDRPVQTLLSRSLIEEVGRKDTPGKPILYGTTKDFLTYFGLTSLEELPPLPEEEETEDLNREADLFFEQFAEEFKEENN